MVNELNLLMGVISPTIVLHPAWKDSCPDWLKERIRIERIANLNSKEKIASDWEALAYVSTVSLAQPLSNTWFKIYSYLFHKLLPNKAKAIGLDNKELQPYEMRELEKLKLWIFKQRDSREKERFKK